MKPSSEDEKNDLKKKVFKERKKNILNAYGRLYITIHKHFGSDRLLNELRVYLVNVSVYAVAYVRMLHPVLLLLVECCIVFL